MNNTFINNDLGKAFGHGLTGVGIFFFIGGVYQLVYDSLILGFILLLTAGVLVFTRKGIQLDLETKKFKAYELFFFFIKIGSWKSLEGFTDVSVMQFNRGEAVNSMSARRLSNTRVKYEVYLLNKTHLLRILIASFTEKEEAIKYANMIKEQSDFQYSDYNPESRRR